ncbi:MAG TPA: protein kinase, partial [Kofleriaceae bacterium]|nr:protein kinase [Kofleriaceae bacterium]
VLERHEEGPPVPRILDFGLAISTHERDEGPGRLTEFGFIVGTPMYIAPEQALDRAVDHRADLFALGVVMYEMLAGKPPFDGKPVEIAHKNVSQPPPPFAERSPGLAVTPELERVVHRLLAKSPDDRFGSAAELCDALAEVERRAGERETYGAGLGAVGWSEPHDAARPAGPFARFFGGASEDGDGDFAFDPADGAAYGLLLPQNRGRRLAAACAVVIAGGALVFGLAARARSSDEAQLDPPARAAAAAEARIAPTPRVTPLPSKGAEARAPSVEPAAPIARPAAPPVPPAAGGAGGADAANGASAGPSVETPVEVADAPLTAGEGGGEAQAQARAAARKARAQRRVADLEAEDRDDEAYDEDSGEWPAEPDSPSPSPSQGQAAAGQGQAAAAPAPADKSGPIEPPEMSEAEPASPPTTTAAGAAPAPPDSTGTDLAGQPAAPSTRQPPSAPPRRAPATRVQAPPAGGAAPARPVDQNVMIRQLIHDYREVGQAIAALEVRKGDIAARYFRDRYFRVPYSDALRIPSVRRDALVALAALRRELTRAMGGGD